MVIPKKYLSILNLIFRSLMEMGIIAAFVYWGISAGKTTTAKLVLGIGAPAIGLGFWGLVDFRKAGRCSEVLRLTQELLISGLAATALYFAGQQLLTLILAVLSVVHHSMVYLLGERLLKRK